ncbi:MAG TPA: hypothetical protein DD435_07350 [Cyanobacteria bacterium UBA8530]|nr:hypothetical protein [Cyanobacteria bacterium UBA8530]
MPATPLKYFLPQKAANLVRLRRQSHREPSCPDCAYALAEERLAEAQRIARIGSWEWDILAKRVFWSDEHFRLFGFEPRSLQPTFALVLQCVHPEDRDRFSEVVKKASEEHRPFEVDYRAVHSDGTVLFLNSLVRGVWDPAGGMIKLMGISQDVTERRRIEATLDRQIEALERAERFKEESLEALRESERLLSEAQQIAHIGSWEWDIETDRMKCTDEVYRLFGLVPQSFGATIATGHFLYHPDDLTLRTETIVQALRDHRPFAYDHRIIRPDGTIHMLRCTGKVVLDPEEKPLGIIGTSQDVTAIRQAERLKDEFLSAVSHELRTPLNAVFGFGSLLQDGIAGQLNEKQSDFVSKLLLGADRMLVLIDDLLDYARMQAGKFSVSPALTDYPSLVEELVSSFQPDALAKRIEMKTSVEVAVLVCLDRRRIIQVIANLLSNAIKFTPNGGKVQLRAFLKDDRLVTEISDSGHGISEEDLPKLFAPFKQLDMGMTRRVGGVGLGLSISKAIIQAHGGTIEARSGPGKGSTFSYSIPQA